MIRNALVSLCMLALAASQASAQVTVYTTQASFLAAINPGYYLETFDSITDGSPPAPLFFSSGPFAYQANTNPGNSFLMAGPGGGGDGGDVWISTATNTDQIIFTFTSGNITAAGGYFFTVNNSIFDPGDMLISTNQSSPYTSSSTSELQFIGFTSFTPFTTLTLEASQVGGTFWPAGNDFIVGEASAVPEPTTWALLGLSCLGAGGYVWNHRRKKTDIEIVEQESETT